LLSLCNTILPKKTGGLNKNTIKNKVFCQQKFCWLCLGDLSIWQDVFMFAISV
jgi:hypothetical protein